MSGSIAAMGHGHMDPATEAKWAKQDLQQKKRDTIVRTVFIIGWVALCSLPFIFILSHHSEQTEHCVDTVYNVKLGKQATCEDPRTKLEVLNLPKDAPQGNIVAYCHCKESK